MGKRRKPKTSIVAVVSDTHCNSTAGLLPPEVRDSHGNVIQANPDQRWLWDQWLDLVKHLKKLKREHKARLIVVFNGDGPDRNRYSGGYDLLVVSREDIVAWTVQALQPLYDVADVWVMNRGTPAHEGGSGELAEMVAHRLAAGDDKVLRDKRTGSLSWFWPTLDVDGVLMAFGHRPISNSRREHTRSDGAKRTAFDLWAAYHRMGDQCPQIMVFSHVHHWAEANYLRETWVYYTPPWKLCDTYGHSIGMSAKREPVGAWVFTVRDGEWQADLWKRQPPAQQVVRV